MLHITVHIKIKESILQFHIELYFMSIRNRKQKSSWAALISRMQKACWRTPRIFYRYTIDIQQVIE